MRLLALVWIVGTVACTRVNPSYGDGGGEGEASDRGDDPSSASVDASASIGDDAEASADDATGFETGSNDESPGETGSDRGSCCIGHQGGGCDRSDVETCVCNFDASCCELEWRKECAEKARFSCNAECGGLDGGSFETSDTLTSDTLTSDTVASDGSSSSDTAGTDSPGSTSDAVTGGSTTGNPDATCCLMHRTPLCGDDAVETCVCETLGITSCCTDQWTDDCVAAATDCGVC